MKVSRSVCFILSLTVVLLSVFSPHGAFSEKSTVSAVSKKSESAPVTADEKDFSYLTVPQGNSKWVIVTEYTGTQSKIIIPDKLGGYPVQALSSDVFKNCKNLTYIKVPAGVTSLSGQTFAECRSLTHIDVDPDNAYFVSENGILYNSDKTSLIAFPNGIGGEFTVPDGVTTISAYAFSGAYKLTKVDMYNSVSAILQNAFQGCFSLAQIRLSDNLAVLGQNALANCLDLRELHLPASLSIIGQNALLGDIDSDNNKYYYFTDGVYCVPDSVAYNYVYNLGIRTPYLKTEERTFTDVKTGIRIIDTEGALPLDKTVYFDITPVEPSEVESLIPIRHNTLDVYDISLTCEGAEYTPTEKLIITFGDLPDGAVVGSAKVYRISGSRVFELIRSPHTPFVAAQTKNIGRFAVITNNDFSKKGDVDGDGIITSYDARFALCLAANLVPEVSDAQVKTADVDGKNGVSTEDARNILRYAAGIIDSFN